MSSWTLWHFSEINEWTFFAFLSFWIVRIFLSRLSVWWFQHILMQTMSWITNSYQMENWRFGPKGQGTSPLPSPCTMPGDVNGGSTSVGVVHHWGWHISVAHQWRVACQWGVAYPWGWPWSFLGGVATMVGSKAKVSSHLNHGLLLNYGSEEKIRFLLSCTFLLYWRTFCDSEHTRHLIIIRLNS